MQTKRIVIPHEVALPTTRTNEALRFRYFTDLCGTQRVPGSSVWN